jgi:hypothetical protein
LGNLGESTCCPGPRQQLGDVGLAQP